MRIGISTAQKRNMMKGKAFNLSHAQLNGEAKKGKVHEVEIAKSIPREWNPRTVVEKDTVLQVEV